MSNEEYKDLVFQKSEENHIWINAFSCINPSDEFLANLGRMVLEKLNNKENLIPAKCITSPAMKKLAELSPQLILRINKS